MAFLRLVSVMLVPALAACVQMSEDNILVAHNGQLIWTTHFAGSGELYVDIGNGERRRCVGDIEPGCHAVLDEVLQGAPHPSPFRNEGKR